MRAVDELVTVFPAPTHGFASTIASGQDRHWLVAARDFRASGRGGACVRVQSDDHRPILRLRPRPFPQEPHSSCRTLRASRSPWREGIIQSSRMRQVIVQLSCDRHLVSFCGPSPVASFRFSCSAFAFHPYSFSGSAFHVSPSGSINWLRGAFLPKRASAFPCAASFWNPILFPSEAQAFWSIAMLPKNSFAFFRLQISRG